MLNRLLRASGAILLCVHLLPDRAVTYGHPKDDSKPKQEVTLQAIFGPDGVLGTDPEPTTWNPAGTELTYLHRAPSGETELWSINASTGQRRILVEAEKLATTVPPASTIEDAVERERRTRYGVAAYHWSPDSRHILFDVNGRLWYYTLGGDKIQELPIRSDASDPKFSPDGKYVSYVMVQDLFVRKIQTGEEKALTQSAADKDLNRRNEILNGNVDWLYEEELGVRSNYAWSPDSKQIAFLQTNLRGVPSHPIVDYTPTHPTARMEKYPLVGDPLPIVRLGVVAVSGGNIHWITLDTRDAYLPRFGWLRAGVLYATVLNRKQQTVDLYFIDANTGNSKLVLSETSEAYIDVETRLQFRPLSGGRFLWMS